MSRCVFLLSAIFLFSPAIHAEDDKQRQDLQTKLEKLQLEVEQLDREDRVDAEVCAKAVEWILRHDEFYKPNYVASAQKTIDLGFQRTKQLRDGKPNWGKAPGKHALAYRSQVDESVQPYIVTLPNDFDSSRRKRWPLYVVLHGRNGSLTEASFIASANGKPAPDDQSWIQLDVFGRTNNAYRWAGETDVFEAMEDVIDRYTIDETRITLWGFSMGGAGAWHLGLHHPSTWVSAGAGAGFVDFYEYQKQKEQLPEYQHRCLRIYDAKDYALNLSVLPMVGYGGENDSQLRSGQIIQEQAEELNVPMTLLVGPNMGHKFDDESKRKFMAFLARYNQKGRKRVPGQREFEFVTYTLKYNTCEWLTIEEQITPYEKTTVNAQLDDEGVLVVETENIAALSIQRTAADRVRLDGFGPFNLNTAGDANLTEVYFVKGNDEWTALNYQDSLDFEQNPDGNKRHNLQGPIDDAFMEPFVCVTGTGKPWSSPLNEYADWTLNRFEKEFDKWMRAEPIVISDRDVNESVIRSKNLILFGDPGSNQVMAEVIQDLPLEWTDKQITFGGETYSTDNHALVMIFPNPQNPKRYVVINSGMTTHEKDFKASNSWLFPKLGDYAVIQFNKDGKKYNEQVIHAGIFDSHWNN